MKHSFDEYRFGAVAAEGLEGGTLAEKGSLVARMNEILAHEKLTLETAARVMGISLDMLRELRYGRIRKVEVEDLRLWVSRLERMVHH